MKLSKFLITGVLAAAALTAQAQTRKESEASTSEQRLAEEIGLERLPNGPVLPTDVRNASLLVQQGASHRGTIEQNNTGALTNTAIIQQVGFGHTATVSQTGSGNRTAVNQSGAGNQADSEITGNDNELSVTQRGNGNVVNSDIINDGRRYQIEQRGNNNTLQQLETTSASPRGYSVEMRGSGINITIEQGRAW